MEWTFKKYTFLIGPVKKKQTKKKTPPQKTQTKNLQGHSLPARQDWLTGMLPY